MKDKILKMEFLAWVVFLIPSFVFIFGSYGLYRSMVLLGQGIHFTPFIGPLFGVVSAFFFGRFFVERTKHKMYKKEVDRLNKRLNTEYPDRLEDLES